MNSAHATVELFAQISRALHFSDDRQALKDREWMSLLFLSRANKFSRTPSGLASFIEATKATTSQIIRTLVEKSYLVRERSQRDERSITLWVTPEAEKLIACHGPANRVLAAVAALEPEDDEKLRSLLHQLVARIDWPPDRAGIGCCRDCLFLIRGTPREGSGNSRMSPDFTCRFHRANIEPNETDRLCATFVRASS
jgi:MarR family transcriptional regulator, negative regulator of the multidrug operon emrRAB